MYKQQQYKLQVIPISLKCSFTIDANSHIGQSQYYQYSIHQRYFANMMSQIRKISKQISSNYGDDPRGLVKEIPKSVLDKYLHEDSPCLDSMERLTYKILPYWNISLPRMRKNITSLLQAKWEFDYITQSQVVADNNITHSIIQDINDPQIAGKNISIYLVFWLPLTTMLLAHVFHNAPNEQNRFGVLGVGFVMLGFMLLVSYALYVFANTLASPYNMYLQHLCPSSYIAIVDFMYAIICAASPTVLLIPMTILYVCGVTWLHFRLYNQALKPTLLQMIVLFCMLTVLHASAAYFYYLNFSWFWTHQQQATSPVPKHDLTRHFQGLSPSL